MVYLLGRVISFSRSWPLSRQADKVQVCSVEVGVERENEINESGCTFSTLSVTTERPRARLESQE